MNSPIIYGSVCSGIEAATAAWHPLGWKPEWFCEIEPFPSAVLAHHHPEVNNYGDFTQLLDPTHPARHGAPIDLLVGGTPCQSFSHAGGRAGLADPRGQLLLRYLDLVGVLRPRWLVWENVPGVLSSGGGRDFGALLGGLADLGYGVAYRVLDARFFGVPQRRRRVFVVGHSGGDPERAARVLALDEGVRGHSASRGGARKEAAAAVGSGAAVGGEPFTLATRTRQAGVVLEYRQDGTADCLRAPNGGRDGIGVGAVAVTPFDTTQGGAAVGGEQVTSFVSTMQSGADGGVYADGTIGTLRAKTPHAIARTIISFTAAMGGNDGGVYADGTVATLRVEAQPAVALPTDCVGFQSNLGSHGGGAYEGESVTLKAVAGGRGNPAAVAFKASHYTRGKDGAPAEVTPPLSADADRGDQDTLVLQPVSTSVSSGRGWWADSSVAASLRAQDSANKADTLVVKLQNHGSVVRRLTPRECERLQGFPDDHTLIPWKGKPATDGHRYKALGNSMAVPVMRWIGERIQQEDARE